MTTDCIFCRIASGEIPAAKVYEDERVVAFLDINPLSAGHTLVIPRAHYRDITEVPPDELAAISRSLPALARAVIRATEADGLNVTQNNGRAAGQLVDHFHIHLIPRKEGDGLFARWPQGKYGEGEMEKVARSIREALS